MAPKQQAVKADRGDQQNGGTDGEGHRDQVDDPQLVPQILEAVMERQGQQQAGEELDSGLYHPQFLQKAEPVTVQPLRARLMTSVFVPALVTLKVIHVDLVGSSFVPAR